MSDDSGENAAPVFVLCTSRSGSTLLRYILNAHPRAVCPPELHFVPAAQRMINIFANSIYLAAAPTVQERVEMAVDRVAEIFRSTMREYCQANGADVWCEKSVSSVDLIELLKRMFPDARFICLYRHALDQLASSLESLKFDPGGNAFGFTHYLDRTKPSRCCGLVDYWIEKNSTIVSFEDENVESCYRLRYEDIVLDTASTIKGIFEFMGLEWSDDYVDRIFTAEHYDGPGDWKIKNTNSIVATSVGRFDPEIVSELDEDRKKSINKLHAILGYDEVE